MRSKRKHIPNKEITKYNIQHDINFNVMYNTVYTNGN